MAEKNRYGQYFTISLIADFMVSLISHSKDSRILEPSCGKGVFLDHLVNSGFKNISAYEIDATLGAKYDFIKFVSFLSVSTSEKYNVVIGNPPYIRWKNIEPELKRELGKNQLWNRYFNSLCDYLFIFILKSIEHLEEYGELIFICTEYWMNTTHSATLRNYMCANGYFSEIYHFKETPLFENVTASFVIFKFVKSKEKRSIINLYSYNKDNGLPTKEELYNRTCFNKETIPCFRENSRWILATQDVQDKLNKFEDRCSKISSNFFDRELYRIGDYCDIGNGMVSGLDAAFQLSEVTKLNEEEHKSLIDVFKAKDLSAYKNKNVTKYIFVQVDMNEDEFEKRYPYFAAHFKSNIEKLNRRYSYNKVIPYWRFVFPRNQKLFERDEARIFVPCKERISNKNYFRFCYAPPGVYPTQDVTAVFRKKNCLESLEYILAYLNNKRVFDWLEFNGIVKGSIVEFSEAPIASIPFRPIDWKNSNEIAIHAKITQAVQDYLKDNSKEHLENINILFNKLFHE